MVLTGVVTVGWVNVVTGSVVISGVVTGVDTVVTSKQKSRKIGHILITIIFNAIYRLLLNNVFYNSSF